MSWVAVGVTAVTAVGSAVAANQQSKNAKQAANAVAQNQVAPPDYNAIYRKGLQDQYMWNPIFAQQEMDLRKRFAPQTANLAASLYGPMLQKFAGSNMRTLRTIDPQSIEAYRQLYGNVSGDLALGHNIDPQLLSETEQQIRRAQTARGNFLGNAPISAEASFTAAEREREYQQRIANMMNFLRGPTPEGHFAELAGAGSGVLGAAIGGAAAPGYQYIQPPQNIANSMVSNAAAQWQGQANNANRVGDAQAAAAMNQTNPWAAALEAAAGSASTYLANRPRGGYGGTTGAGSGPMGTYSAPYGWQARYAGSGTV